jgi:Ala-tRNA(Pro) deacylase
MGQYSDKDLFSRLDELGIKYKTYEHPELHTVGESQALRGEMTGAHVKNLFLRDKKRRFWLVTVLEDRVVDLKKLRHQIGAQGNLSFGNAGMLLEKLGVTPGSVTAFGICNDTDGQVTMVMDKAILDQEIVNAHPLRNDMTTALLSQDLLVFLVAEQHAPMILDFDHVDE